MTELCIFAQKAIQCGRSTFLPYNPKLTGAKRPVRNEMTEQPMFVTPEDWDIAVMHGQYSQGDDREDLVTFRRIDLAAYLGQMRVEQAGVIGVLRGLLQDCKYPLLVAKADAQSSGEQEDLEGLAKLLRSIDAAMKEQPNTDINEPRRFICSQ